MPDIGNRLDNDRRQQRIVGEPRIRRPDIVGVASTDPYAPPGPSKLGQLAQALSRVQPSVARFGGAIADKAIESDQMAGKALADKMALEGKTWAQAVRDGTVPALSSPWFMAALEEQEGQNAGHQYGTDLAEAMANSPLLQTSLKLQDFDDFERDFRQGWVQQHFGGSDGLSERTSTAFNHLVEAEIGTRRRPEFAAGLEKRLKKKASDDFAANLTQWLVKDSEQPKDVKLNTLTTLRQLQMDIGRGDSDVDLDTATALGEAALATGRYEYLELAKDVATSNDTALAYHPKLAEVLRGYESKLTQKVDQEERLTKARVKKEKEAYMASARKAIYEEISKSPLMPDFKGVVDAAPSEYKADVMEAADKLQKAYNKAARGDENEFSQMRYRIRFPNGHPVTDREIDGKVAGGLISFAQGRDLQAEIEDRNVKLANLREKQKSRSLAERQSGELLKTRLFQQIESEVNAILPASMEHNGVVMRTIATTEAATMLDNAILSGEVDPYNTAQAYKWKHENLDPYFEQLRFQVKGAYGDNPTMGQEPILSSGSKAPSGLPKPSSSPTPSHPTGKPSKPSSVAPSASGRVSYKAPSGTTIEMTMEDFEFAKANKRLSPELVQKIKESKADPREVIRTLQTLGRSE